MLYILLRQRLRTHRICAAEAQSRRRRPCCHNNHRARYSARIPFPSSSALRCDFRRVRAVCFVVVLLSVLDFSFGVESVSIRRRFVVQSIARRRRRSMRSSRRCFAAPDMDTRDSCVLRQPTALFWYTVVVPSSWCIFHLQNKTRPPRRLAGQQQRFVVSVRPSPLLCTTPPFIASRGSQFTWIGSTFVSSSRRCY